MSPLGPFTRSPRRRRARPDAGQAAIVAALRVAGCSVEILADVGRGVPDLLVGRAGVTYLLEIKAPRAGSGKRGIGSGGNAKQTDLNDREEEWHAAWRGQVAVVRSVKEALAAVREVQSADRWSVRDVDARLATFHRDLDALEADVAAEVACGDAVGKRRRRS